MRFNAVFEELVGLAVLKDVTSGDVPEEFRKTIEDGWMRDARGAWLLRDFATTYHGSAEAFADLTAYEAAVNGRAIPDLDLTIAGKARAAVLARRGVAFARAALQRLNTEHPDHPPAVAYISISDLEMDNEITYVGDVTLVTAHEGESPYVRDLEAVTANAIVALDSAE